LRRLEEPKDLEGNIVIAWWALPLGSVTESAEIFQLGDFIKAQVQTLLEDLSLHLSLYCEENITILIWLEVQHALRNKLGLVN